jgi:hypothetical protein
MSNCAVIGAVCGLVVFAVRQRNHPSRGEALRVPAAEVHSVDPAVVVASEIPLHPLRRSLRDDVSIAVSGQDPDRNWGLVVR